MKSHSHFFSPLLALLSVSIMSSATPERSANILTPSGKPTGQAVLKETSDGVQLSLHLKGLPAGTHAVHIHEVGKCDGPDFKSAGDHLNPLDKEHGKLNPEGAHLGDLPNIEIPRNGVVRKDLHLKGFSLKPAAARTLATETGTSLVIHAKADDHKTDPSGKSGDRVYCAVLSEPRTTISK